MRDHDAPPETVDAPLIPASVMLSEITPKAVVLSIVLAAVLAGANAYLGLFAGMTISASIPAAVVSMAVLRLFRHSNILENNIVQTAVSSGEALAAGVIFTIPGLLLIGHWDSFDYWQTFTVALVGGVLGVLFTIPLRRALIVHARLRFPEGVATAEVLKVGASADADAGGRFRLLLGAAALGGGFKFAEAGLKLWSESLEGVVQVGRATFYGGLNLSPALLAVGYIIGLNTAVVVFLGGASGWLVLLPLYQALIDPPYTLTGMAAAKTTWSGNPVSGVTIATIMLASLLLLGMLGRENPAGPAAALLVGAVVCCAAAM
nr:oligopeptide transporter, OPT family [Nitrospira sp.]